MLFCSLAQGMLQKEPPVLSMVQRGRRGEKSLVSREKAVCEPRGMFPQVWLGSHLQHQVFEFSASFYQGFTFPERATSLQGNCWPCRHCGG